MKEVEYNMIYQVHDTTKISALYDGWEESLIYSCLQQHMGVAYANEEYTSAFLMVDVFAFFAGEASYDLMNYCKDHFTGFRILTIRDFMWDEVIRAVYPMLRLAKRYAIKREPSIFNYGKLEAIVQSVKTPYTLHLVDEAIYHRLKQISWSCDLCSVFQNQEEYLNHGLGVVAMLGDEIVSGASSYVYYDQGIEVEIDTQSDHRRKGLALACGAKLLLECHKRGWYASWDAQNVSSVALAEKLGYHFNYEYEVYEVQDDELLNN